MKNILVVEDENIVAKDLSKRLEKMGYNVVGIAGTGEKAIEKAFESEPDLILMDIMLKGDMTGIEAAKTIKEEIEVPVIFLTAYADESTLDKAKMAEPHGYILKPFKEIDIQSNIEMALHKFEKEKSIKAERDMLFSVYNKRGNNYVFIKSGGKYVKLRNEDILFIEALKDYVVFNTVNEQITLHSTMKDIVKKLSDEQFFRIHRSYIIQTDKIKEISSTGLMLEGYKKQLPIGGSYKTKLFELLELG